MTSGSRLSLGKKLLFSVLVTVVFFAALEGVLAVAGVEPKLYSDDPYVGFASTSPLFREVTGDDGRRWYETSPAKLTLFNEQRFAADKPRGVTRIFCIGGSTTYGRPYDDRTSFCGWLRAFLDEVRPGDFEVVNAGGVSYASYRAALVMEELAAHDPDLFVVYSGHNEFLEERTYGDLKDMPAAVRGLGGLAARTRVHAVVSDALGRFRAPDEEVEPATVLAEEVQTRLDTSVGPEAYERNPELRDAVLAHYRFNLARMVDIGRAAGAEVVLVKPASNLADCTPFKSQHRVGLGATERAEWNDALSAARLALEEDRAEEALAALDRAAAIDSLHAELHFLRGRALERLRRPKEALEAYRRARDEDVCPLRALTQMGPIVADVASDRDAPLADFQARVLEVSQDGLPGEELFLDHVHPTIEGNRLLAETILATLADEGLLDLPDSWGPAAAERAAQRVRAQLDSEAHALALMKLSKVFGWAGKLEDAARLAAQAVDRLPGDARVQHQAGLMAQLTGRTSEAVEHYRRAVAIQPDADEPHANLGVLLKEAGDLEGAETHLRACLEWARTPPVAEVCTRQLAETLVGLGFLDYRAGRWERAAERFTESNRLRPDQADTLSRLGLARQAAGDVAGAVKALERSVAINPDNASAWNQLAVAQALAGELDRARTAWRRSVDLDRRILNAPHAAPRVLHAHGRAEAAQAIMR